MKLRAALTAQPVPLLHSIASETDLETGDHLNKPALIDALSRHLAQPAAVKRHLSRLSAPCRDLLTHLAAEGGELPRSVAIKELGHGFEHRFTEMIESATLLGLAFQDTQVHGNDDPLVGVPESILKSFPLPANLQNRLRALLVNYSLGQLKTFADDLGVKTRETRRPFLIELIRDHLSSPDELKAYLKALSEDRRDVLDFVLSESSPTPADVESRLGEVSVRALEDLIWKTPLFVAPESSRLSHDHPLVIASDLAQILESLARAQGGRLESPPEEALNDKATAPSRIAALGDLLPRDLGTLLGLIERKRPKTLKRGGMPKGELREAGRFFKADEDPGYPDFLMLFAEDAGLLSPENGRWVLSKTGPRRLANHASLLKSLVTFWKETDRWNEWAADRASINGRKGRANELKALRAEVLAGLAHCPDNTWVAYNQFYRTLAKLSPAFKTLTDGPAAGTVLSSRGTTADELLRRMLVGAIAWMGLIDIGNPGAFERPLHASEGACFKLTAAGRNVLKRSKEDVSFGVPSNPESRFIIQPNLEVLAPPELPVTDYVQLCGLTDLKSIDVVSHFQITREAILGALNRGFTSTRILRFLRERSATGVPDMVKFLVKDCGDKHGEIQIRLASGYVCVDIPARLDELFAQKQIAELLGERFAPTVAGIKVGARPESLAQLLTKQGYMPSFEHVDQSETESSHQVHLSTTDLSELVGFLESAVSFLDERLGEKPHDITHLAQRLRRVLRRTPGESIGSRTEAHADLFERIIDQVRESDGSTTLAEFTGPNPASENDDIMSVVDFAIRRKLCLRLEYGAQGNGDRVVQPTSEDEKMLYAYCRNRKGDRVFRLDRIHRVELLGETF